MNEEKPSPKRKIRWKRWLVLFGSLLAIISVVGWQYRWYKLPHYQPSSEYKTDVKMRTPTEHDLIMKDREWPYLLELENASGGKLFYYGSYHTKNPDDKQIAEIQKRWKEFQPTVALCESRLGFYVGGLRGGVGMFSEPGAVFALARRDCIPVYTLEPTWEHELQSVLEDFEKQDVATFYFLRRFTSERNSSDEDSINAMSEKLLKKRMSRPLLKGAFSDLKEFDAYWKKNYEKESGDWRTIPNEALWPNKDPGLLHAMAFKTNSVRNKHMANVIIELVNRGERVFAVCGGSHVVTQEPVLSAAILGKQD